MKKKLLCLILVLLMIPCYGFGENSISVTVDGVTVNLTETQPYSKNGTVMLPVRAVGTAAGSQVRWNEKSQRVIVEGKNSVITLEIGSTEVYVNGEKKSMNAAPEVQNGTTYVPLEFVANILEMEAVYANSTVAISTGNSNVSGEIAEKTNSILKNITGAQEFEVQRPQDNGIVVDVTDYGASPSNTPPQNIEAFEKAIAAVKEKGAWKLNIPTGEYRLGGGKKYAIELFDITNLKIEGNGSKLIFSQHITNEANGAYFGVERTETLELCNITLDWDWDLYPLFAIAKVCGADENKGTVEFEIDNEYSKCKLVDGLVYGGMCGYDIEKHNKSDLKGYQVAGTINGMERTGENTVQLLYNVKSNAAKAKMGDYAFLYFRTPQYINAFRMAGNRNMTFDNIEVNTAPYQITYADDSEYYQIINSRFQPQPGRRFCSYGGLETHSVNGNFKLENCIVDGVCDDILHLSNHFFGGGVETGNPKLDDRTVMLDYLQFWAVGNDIYEGAKFVCGSKQFEMYDWESTIESFEWEMNVYTGNSNHRCKVTFKDPLPENYDKFSVFWNADKFKGNYIVRNNEMKNSMCHGLYIGLPNGLIENNKLDNFAYPSLVLNCVIRWGRWYIGTPIDNVIIRGNVITNNNTARRDPATLFVGGGIDNQPSNYFPVDGRIAKNVLVEGNVVDNSSWSAFGMFSATDTVVRNNKFLNSNNLPTKPRFKGWGSVYIVGCDNIVFTGNEISNGSDALEDGVFVDDTSSTNVYAENNKGIDKVKNMADLVAGIEQKYDADGNLIVDVDSYGYTESAGSWSNSTGSGYSSVTRQSSSTGAQVQWKPMLRKGKYKVSIYKVVYADSSDNEAQIIVKHKNGTFERTLNYTDGANGWVELGEFEFEEGNLGYVQNTRTRSTARASAVKFEKVSD